MKDVLLMIYSIIIIEIKAVLSHILNHLEINMHILVCGL